MKAVYHDKKSYSGRSWSEDYEVPSVSKPHHVLVKVSAAAINPVDYKLPFIMTNKKVVGLDFSGVVTQVGSEVTHFAVGDSIFGNTSGTLSEYALCRESKIAKVPEGLSMVQAAAMPTTYLTAYQALKGHGFQKGMSLLVIGASGGCGTSGVQIGKALGAAEIVGVCSKKNEDLVKGLGADSVVDYNTQNVVDVCGKNHFDHVFDTASSSGGGEAYYKQSMAVLKPSSSISGSGVYTYLNGGILSFIRKFTIGTPNNRDLVLTNHSRVDLEGIVSLMKPSESFEFLPIIHQTLPFNYENVEAGFKELKSRRARGKIVFNF